VTAWLKPCPFKTSAHFVGRVIPHKQNRLVWGTCGLTDFHDLFRRLTEAKAPEV